MRVNEAWYSQPDTFYQATRHRFEEFWAWTLTHAFGVAIVLFIYVAARVIVKTFMRWRSVVPQGPAHMATPKWKAWLHSFPWILFLDLDQSYVRSEFRRSRCYSLAVGIRKRCLKDLESIFSPWKENAETGFPYEKGSRVNKGNFPANSHRYNTKAWVWI